MLPLSEKTVVVTRPREQADELKFELERLGARVVLFPTIEIAAPESYADLDAAINNLSSYDWLILTSANAAEHFLRRLTANNLETAELDYLRLCAIGEATAERLRLARVHVDLLPANSSAEGVFEAFVDYLGGIDALKDLHFLLPRSAIGRDFLPKKLVEVGAIVTDVVAYQTILPEKPETGKLQALLEGGAIDCLAFSSPSTFTNFLEIFKNVNLPHLIKDVAIACIGQTTAKAVRQQGFKVAIISDETNSKSLALSISNHFSQ